MSQDLLTLEQFAEVLAHHEHFGHEHAAEVCRRLKVDSQWDASFAHWSSMLHDDALSEEPQLTPTFAKSLGDTKTLLKDEDPKLEDIGARPDADPPAPSAADAAPPSPVAEAGGEADAPPPANVPPPAHVPVAEPPAPAVEPQPPAAMPSPAVQPLVTQQPPTAQPSVAQPSVAQPLVAQPPVVQPPIAPLSGERATVAGPSPWAKGEARTAAVAAPEPVPPRVVDAPPAGAPGNVNRTAFVSALSVDDPLPFSGRSEATTPEPAAASESIDVAGMTAEVPAILIGNETLPFIEGSALGIDDEILDRLTIEQYASLTAELAVRPDRAATLRRYGVDDNTFEILEETWQRRFQSDAAQKQRFSRLVQTYRQWLDRNSPRTT